MKPQGAYGGHQLQHDMASQWDELDLHLALDELVKGEGGASTAPGAMLGGGGLLPHPHLGGKPGESQAEATWDSTQSGSDATRGRARRGPRPRLFKKNTCQADNCAADLGSASFYYQRNHICPAHLKSGSYDVRGVATRFCQRCGVGHPVEEFSGAKRSCKKALERHNQRRREKQGGGSEGGTESPWSLPPDLLPMLGMTLPDGLFALNPAEMGPDFVHGAPSGPRGDLDSTARPPQLAQGEPALRSEQLDDGAATLAAAAQQQQQQWLAATQGWGPQPPPGWQQHGMPGGVLGLAQHTNGMEMFGGLVEPALSVGSVSMPVLSAMDGSALYMNPMPADQLSWLSSQL